MCHVWLVFQPYVGLMQSSETKRMFAQVPMFVLSSFVCSHSGKHEQLSELHSWHVWSWWAFASTDWGKSLHQLNIMFGYSCLFHFESGRGFVPAIRVTFQGNLFGSGGHVFRSLSWYEIPSKLAWIKYVFKANEIHSILKVALSCWSLWWQKSSGRSSCSQWGH